VARGYHRAVVAFLSVTDALHRLAEPQHGHVTRQQLLTTGISGSEIQHLVENGLLIRVHAGVYALGYRQRTPMATAAAARLACGDDAVLSHDSAAALYGLRQWPRIPEVTTSVRRRRPGIRVHRSGTLTRADLTRQYGIQVTTAARAILDISGRLSDAELIQIVSDARRAGRLGPTALYQLLAASVRAARLIDPQQAPSESIFMAHFLLFLKRYRLPIPVTEYWFHGFRVDAIYPAHRLIIELDSWEFHSNPLQFERDRGRDAVAIKYRHDTLRITWKRMTEHPRQLAAELRALLADRAPQAR
jgi:hypothetical protein